MKKQVECFRLLNLLFCLVSSNLEPIHYKVKESNSVHRKLSFATLLSPCSCSRAQPCGVQPPFGDLRRRSRGVSFGYAKTT